MRVFEKSEECRIIGIPLDISLNFKGLCFDIMIIKYVYLRSLKKAQNKRY